jgi:hypothetical protein
MAVTNSKAKSPYGHHTQEGKLLGGWRPTCPVKSDARKIINLSCQIRCAICMAASLFVLVRSIETQFQKFEIRSVDRPCGLVGVLNRSAARPPHRAHKLTGQGGDTPGPPAWSARAGVKRPRGDGPLERCFRISDFLANGPGNRPSAMCLLWFSRLDRDEICLSGD